MTGRLRSFLVMSLVALLLAVPATRAWAHASLQSTTPAEGATVSEAPEAFVLTFSEPVSPLVLRLVRPDGSAIALDRFTRSGPLLDFEAPPGLGRGTHVLMWRAVSADGHPIGGSFSFSIGEASARPTAAEDTVDQVVGAGLWLSRIALYVGLFIGVGGVFALRVLFRGVSAGQGVILAALAAGVLGTTLSAGFQGLDALGAPIGMLFDPVVWSTGLGTSFGLTVWASLLALALALLGLALPSSAGAVAAVAALLAAAAGLAVSGHAGAASPQWLMRAAVALHAAAIAVWIGALVPLRLALKQAGPDALPALRRFSRAIPMFVAILVAAGVVLAVVQVESPGALFDTAYGKILLAKLALLVGLFLLVAVNRWTLTAAVQAGDGSATRRLVRSIAVETLVAVAIFGAAAAWRFTPPPRVLAAEAARPATVELHSDKATVMLWVGPARVGAVDVVANVLDADFGRLAPEDVSVSFSSPTAGIEPFSRRLSRGAGMADWHAPAVTIPVPGLWKARVDVRLADGASVSLEGDIRIRP